MKCETYKPLDECAWVHNQTIIKPGENSIYKHVGKNRRGSCSLRIQSVKHEDIGLWSCNPFVTGVSKQLAVSTKVVLKGRQHKILSTNIIIFNSL